MREPICVRCRVVFLQRIAAMRSQSYTEEILSYNLLDACRA